MSALPSAQLSVFFLLYFLLFPLLPTSDLSLWPFLFSHYLSAKYHLSRPLNSPVFVLSSLLSTPFHRPFSLALSLLPLPSPWPYSPPRILSGFSTPFSFLAASLSSITSPPVHSVSLCFMHCNQCHPARLTSPNQRKMMMSVLP